MLSMPEAEFSYHPRLIEPVLSELADELSAFMIVGPRAVGKTTTAERRAVTTVRLNVPAQAAAFEADPDAALQGLEEPVLLDEWQIVPDVLGAVARSVNDDPRPGRFFLTGSVRAEIENTPWPGTGRLQRIALYPMSMREQCRLPMAQTFIDKLVTGTPLQAPREAIDLRGYLELVLTGGFPRPALALRNARARASWFDSYISDLLTHDVELAEEPKAKKRDPVRLRRYFEAYALNSAGVLDSKTIYDAARIRRETAEAYEDLFTRLFVIEQVPAWTSNRLKRLVLQPKRYIVDPALLAHLLRLDVNGILRDGDLLGRVLDTFAMAQLRPELSLSSERPHVYHLRTKGGEHEIDLLAELGGFRVVGIEIKAAAAPRAEAAKHLSWLRDNIGERFLAGVVLHTGPAVYSLGDRITAAPISTLWTD
jgi:predicted AAA+ superfamily ATPase